MKNYVYDFKYANIVNFIIADLLRPTTRLSQFSILNDGRIMKKQ